MLKFNQIDKTMIIWHWENRRIEISITNIFHKIETLGIGAMNLIGMLLKALKILIHFKDKLKNELHSEDLED